ncbi:MAG: hypothetical protein DI598_05410, partial [Pseudopedobacter saltans]
QQRVGLREQRRGVGRRLVRREGVECVEARGGDRSRLQRYRRELEARALGADVVLLLDGEGAGLQRAEHRLEAPVGGSGQQRGDVDVAGEDGAHLHPRQAAVVGIRGVVRAGAAVRPILTIIAGIDIDVDRVAIAGEANSVDIKKGQAAAILVNTSYSITASNNAIIFKAFVP